MQESRSDWFTRRQTDGIFSAYSYATTSVVSTYEYRCVAHAPGTVTNTLADALPGALADAHRYTLARNTAITVTAIIIRFIAVATFQLF